MSNTGGQSVNPVIRVGVIAVALGCMLAYSRAFAAGFAGALPMCSTPDMGSFSFACSSARVFAIVAVVLLGCMNRASLGRMALVVSGIVMAVSGFALSGGLGLAEGTPFALLAGAASGLVMLAMMMLLSSLRIRGIMASSFGGLLIGGLLIMGLMRFGAIPATVVLVVSGLLAGVLIPVADPLMESCRADGLPSAHQIAAFPWFAAIAFAISGLMSTVFYGAAIALEWNTSGQMNYPLFGVAIVAVLGISAYIALQGEETSAAVWIPLFALLLTAMALACFDDPAVNPSVMGLLFAAVFAYHFLRWLVFPVLVSFSGMPRMLICGVFLVVTSSFIGVSWGESVATAFPAGLRDQGGFVAFSALVLLMVFAAALFVNRTRLEDTQMQLSSALVELQSASRQIESLSAQVREGAVREAEEAAPPTVEQRCESLAQSHGLTAREAEILGLTARGHSSTFIAEQLFISASTVRFHQQNIYRKLDVHSRQELLSLVNEKEGQ